jgi:Tfp pilus assembly protein PilO
MAQTNAKRIPTLSSNQFTVVMIMIAVVVWVLGIVVSRAVFKTISFNNRVLDKKQEIDRTLGENLKTVDGLRAAYQELETLGPPPRTVLQALPDSLDTPALVSRLESLIHASGLEFSTFTLTNSTIQNPVSPSGTSASQLTDTPRDFTYTISANGSYPSVLKMFKNFENEITPTRLVEVKIQGTQQEAVATLTIKGFYQPRASTNFIQETFK